MLQPGDDLRLAPESSAAPPDRRAAPRARPSARRDDRAACRARDRPRPCRRARSAARCRYLLSTVRGTPERRRIGEPSVGQARDARLLASSAARAFHHRVDWRRDQARRVGSPGIDVAAAPAPEPGDVESEAHLRRDAARAADDPRPCRLPPSGARRARSRAMRRSLLAAATGTSSTAPVQSQPFPLLGRETTDRRPRIVQHDVERFVGPAQHRHRARRRPAAIPRCRAAPSPATADRPRSRPPGSRAIRGCSASSI